MKTLLHCFGFIFATFELYAQSQTFSISPGSSDAPMCPNVAKTYSVVVSPGSLPSCSYKWTAVNGYFPNNGGGSVAIGQNLTSIAVKWEDTHNGGTLQVEVSSCSNSFPSGELASKTYSIATFFGQTFPHVGSEDALGNVTYDPVNIPYCDVPVVTLWVDHMYMNHTGGIGEPGLVEGIYVFNLPSGWKQVTTNATGAITSSLNFISITPISGSTSTCANGNVTVQALVPASFSCGNSSQQATIHLNRTGSVSFSQSPTYTGPKCGNTIPITFTANTFSCSPTYAWAFPSGWSGSSTSNSITLTPSGSYLDAGQIKVTVFSQCSNPITYIYTTPAFVSPGISGPDIVCNSESYSLTNIVNSTINWSSSYPSGLTINSSGTATRVNNYSGTANISVAIVSGGCTGMTVPSKNVVVGKGIDHATLVNVEGYRMGFNQFFVTGRINPEFVPGGTTYSWFVDGDLKETTYTGATWDYTGTYNPETDCSPNFSYHSLSFVIEGSCDAVFSDSYYFNFSCGGGLGGGGELRVSPNPVKGKITLSLPAEIKVDPLVMEYTVHIVDKDGTKMKFLVLKNLPESIDVSDLQKGIYFVLTKHGDQNWTSRIILE